MKCAPTAVCSSCLVRRTGSTDGTETGHIDAAGRVFTPMGCDPSPDRKRERKRRKEVRQLIKNGSRHLSALLPR
jgi:hypothetical protein